MGQGREQRAYQGGFPADGDLGGGNLCYKKGHFLEGSSGAAPGAMILQGTDEHRPARPLQN